jgi:hypothetical protein
MSPRTKFTLLVLGLALPYGAFVSFFAFSATPGSAHPFPSWFPWVALAAGRWTAPPLRTTGCLKSQSLSGGALVLLGAVKSVSGLCSLARSCLGGFHSRDPSWATICLGFAVRLGEGHLNSVHGNFVRDRQPSRQGTALFSVRLELWRSTGAQYGHVLTN